MAITNTSKPSTGSSEHNLTIGGAFGLLVGGIYQLIISPLSGSGMTNSSKVSIGETWGSITSTWASETRTWLAVSQLIGNTSKPTTTISNASKPA